MPPIAESPSRPTQLFTPTVNPVAANVQLYFDHSPTPQTFEAPVSQDGITVEAGDSNIAVNLQSRPQRSGWASHRFAGHGDVYGYGDKYISVALSGVQASESVRIFQITINGAQTGGA